MIYFTAFLKRANYLLLSSIENSSTNYYSINYCYKKKKLYTFKVNFLRNYFFKLIFTFSKKIKKNYK